MKNDIIANVYIVKTYDRHDTVFQRTILRFAHMPIHIDMLFKISTINMDKFRCIHKPIDFGTISTINNDSVCL